MSASPCSSSFSSHSFSGLSLTPQNIHLAHNLVNSYIHRTPLLTCQTLNVVASTPRFPGAASPKIHLFFKCENCQKIGAFKARGAFHAVIRLIEKLGLDEVRSRGVITHSSGIEFPYLNSAIYALLMQALTRTGNHAQALSLAASTFAIPAHIVMPTISTSSKIAATQALTPHVIFSGSTSQERKAKVEEVVKRTGAFLVPPFDHADIILGQGTVGLEMEEQFAVRKEGQVCTVYHALSDKGNAADETDRIANEEGEKKYAEKQRRIERPGKHFDAIMVPCGGGGLLSGIATYFFDDQHDESHNNDLEDGTLKPKENLASLPSATAPSLLLGQQDEYTLHYEQSSPPPVNPPIPPSQQREKDCSRKTPLIFGAEPTYQGADDALRSVQQGKRIETVKSLTIADGLRTPLGELNWSVISNPKKVRGVYGVNEAQIKEAMRLLLERAKWVVEPSAAVPLAVVLYNEEFRGMVQRLQQSERWQGEEGIQVQPWNIGVVLSGGNTTIDAIVGLFGKDQMKQEEKEDSGGEEKGTEMERQDDKIARNRTRVTEDMAG